MFTVSVNALTPNMSVRTVAAAADCTEWPDVYSGNAGVTRNADQTGSIKFLMYVSGRSRLYVYLVSQQLMNASATAMPTRANASAAAASDSLSRCVI